ncbi:GAF domain-containing protein [Alcanivorax sp.]|uniref:GAF domain-containing protein n=1 Tax=Alcanivorax sp. TaxID=1872427 RepID=UPI0025C239C8|nr:GAF domain-containing protein [Alcanivorax sp.]
MSADVITLPAYTNCQSLLDAHLAELQKRFGMTTWMITRLSGEDLVLLRVRDGHYGLQRGDRLRHRNSYCVRMVELGKPCIVSDVSAHPDFPLGPVDESLDVAAYIGFPLVDGENRLFGTLCAFDPQAQPASLEAALPALTHDAALISFLLNNAVREAREKRLTTFVEHPDRCDDTGLPGKEGWKDICRQEASNCRDFGLEASVLYLQAPEDGSSLTLADSLAALLREQDSIAHLGNNRFGILLADTNEEKSSRVADRIRDALNAKQLLVRIDREKLISG